jgi:hypothetical protein
MKTLPILFAALFAASLHAEDLVPLKLELPKPMFEGTPKPIKNIRNMEPPLKGARPDPMVPKGTKLLSAGKSVDSSDKEPIIGELNYITDGDKEAMDGSWVELGPDLQWAQVDLGQEHALHAIIIWHNHKSPVVYHDVVVQVSNDKEFKSGVVTVYNNDDDNSAGFGVGKDYSYVEHREGLRIDPKGAKGRYVRAYSRGNTADEMNHYTEIEIYGL